MNNKENMFKKVCEYQDGLEKDEVLMAVFLDKDLTDIQILSWHRDNEVCQNIGKDDYIEALMVLNVKTLTNYLVWRYSDGWVKE